MIFITILALVIFLAACPKIRCAFFHPVSTVYYPVHGLLYLLLGNLREIRPLWEEPAQKPVMVLVRPLLPG